MMSLSVRRAWIEILPVVAVTSLVPSSLSVRRAWIEILSGKALRKRTLSLSVRRAWIEIWSLFSYSITELGRSP